MIKTVCWDAISVGGLPLQEKYQWDRVSQYFSYLYVSSFSLSSLRLPVQSSRIFLYFCLTIPDELIERIQWILIIFDWLSLMSDGKLVS